MTRRRRLAGIAGLGLLVATTTLCCAGSRPEAGATGGSGDAACTTCFEDGVQAYRQGRLVAALALFERGCERGEARACGFVADMYRDGEGTAADGDRARARYVRACELGFRQTCAIGASLIQRGRADEGRALLQRGCDGGHPDSCNRLGIALRKGLLGDPDPAASVRVYARSCELGDGEGCFQQALALAGGIGGPGDAARARALYERGCEAGHGGACANLGFALREGSGGPADATQAVHFFERGCTAGSAHACMGFAVALLRGEGGLEVDTSRARSLFEQACEANDAQGCANLGIALREGLGGPADLPRAIPLFERSCAAGVANACVALGAAHYAGKGAEQDRARARALFEKACEGGDEVGCSNIRLLDARAESAAPEPEPRWTTTVGSLTIGSGERTATFREVRSTCSAIPLTLAFGVAAGDVRGCLDGDASRRVSLSVDGGRVVRSRVAPDDAVGRCVVSALGRAPLGGLTCAFEASVSR